MSRIKSQLLTFYTKHLIKYNRTERINVGFAQAQAIGVLYSGDSPKKQEAVDQLITQLNRLGKKVTVLCYAPTPTQVLNLTFPIITYRDIQLWGSINPDQAKTFVNAPFDYLYQVDLESHPVLDYLLAKSRAKCRIGYYCTRRTALFEIMVSFDKSFETSEIDDLTTQMLYYTQ